MKKKYLILMLMAALLVFSGSAFAASISIVNGDFEIGADNDAPPFGWTDTSSATSFWLGVAGETSNPTLAEAALAPPPGLGNFFLTTARDSAGVDTQPIDGQLIQTVDLSPLATAIDAGSQNLHVNFIWASDDYRDTGTFSLHFFSTTDGSGTELGTGYSVAMDDADNYNFVGWFKETVGGLVPVSARSVTLQIDSTRSGGSATNVWIDNISFWDAASNPSPPDDPLGENPVDITATLSWDAPETYTGATYNVYFGTTEPNFNISAPYGLTQIGTAGQSATTVTPVPSPMPTDTTYYWVVDTLEPNTVGTILHQGAAWSFTTIPSTPQIDPQPQNTYFKENDPNVVLTLAATTSYPPLSFEWYKDDVLIPDPDAGYEGQRSDTLVILNPDSFDEASYYCKVIGDNGGFTDSDTAIVREARRVAWYQFENDLTDFVGTNDANEPAGAIAYAAGVPGLSGQSYAADPNGSNYGQLPLDAYPKVGFGNAMQEGTVSFWSKVNSTDSYSQALMGTANDGSTTIFQVEANYSDNNGPRLFLREEDGDTLDLRSGRNVLDDEWHYVVMVYRTNQPTAPASSGEIYIDGELADTAEGTGNLSTFAEFQYPMLLMAKNNRGVVDDPFGGMVDDLQIFNYTKTAEDVAQDYYDVTGQSTCILDRYASEYDFDNNCIFDLSDLAVFFGMWLDTGWYPVMP